MTEIPEADKRLVKDIQKLLYQVSKLRTGLYSTPRPGCACDGKSICAHHAEIYNRLDQAYDILVLASAAARRIE
jgi:hypothetical protein